MRSSLLAALLVGLVLVVSGCRDASPEERYAEGVCSTLLLHGKELIDTYEAVNETDSCKEVDALGQG